MRYPDKVTTYKESSLALFPKVLAPLKEADMSPSILYRKVSKDFSNTNEFIEVLDCLFLLGKVKFVEGMEVLRYVEEDQL